MHKHAEPLWPSIPPAGTAVLLPACTAEEAKEDRKRNISKSFQTYHQRNCVNILDFLYVSRKTHKTGGGLAVNAMSSVTWTLTGRSHLKSQFHWVNLIRQ